MFIRLENAGNTEEVSYSVSSPSNSLVLVLALAPP